jgi:hypothetical protein
LCTAARFAAACPQRLIASVGQEERMNERNRACGVVSIVLAAVNGLGLLAFAFGMLYQRPKLVAVYADLEVALPVATRLLISIPGSVVVAVTLMFLALLVAKELIPSKTVPLVLNLVWLVAGIALAIFFSMAMMAPLVTTIEQM